MLITVCEERVAHAVAVERLLARVNPPRMHMYTEGWKSPPTDKGRSC